MRWIAGLCAMGVLLAVASLTSASTPIRTATFEPAKPKLCPKRTVLATFGEAGSKCVKVGQSCNRKRNADYTRAELRCARRTIRKGRKRVKVYRLRKLSGAERRFGAPVRAVGGKIPFTTALAAFEKAFGVDLPGFKAPKGLVGRFTSGTGPARWVNAYRKRLTRAQRRVVDATLAPTGAAVSKSQSGGFTQVELEAALDLVIPWEAAWMGESLPFRPEIGPIGEQAPVSGKAEDKVDAETKPKYDKNGKLSGCFIGITPFGLSLKNRSMHPGRSIEGLIAHEMIHCYQGLIAGAVIQDRSKDTGWIVEGFARYAEIEIMAANNPGPFFGRSVGQQIEGKAFFDNPSVPVIDRLYDALIFWQMLKDAGIEPRAANRRGLITLAAAKSDTRKVYDAVVYGDGAGPAVQLLTDAGPSFFRRADLAPIWDIQGEVVNPSDPNNPPPPPTGGEVVEVSNGTSFDLDAPAYAFGYRELSLTADFISVASTEATHGRLRERNGTLEGLPLGAGTYTTLDDPKCPDGTPVPKATPIATGEALTGIAGGPNAARMQIKGQSLADVCAKPEEKPCQFLCNKPKGKGGSNGDPHLSSMDGLHFDFQAAGEFVLVRAGSDLEVQARHEVVPGNKNMTINTQFAMRAGGQRVTVSASGQPEPLIRVNGSERQLPEQETLDLPGGASLTRLAQGRLRVTWPDGSTAEVRSIGPNSIALSIEIALADGRIGKTAGLLGSYDGDLANDLVSRDGKKVPYTALADPGWRVRKTRIKEEYGKTFSERLYKSWGESWRISQAKSLFDYASGQSTATFTNRKIPAKVIDPDNLEGRAEAERICREHGVTDAGPLEDCISDILATGDPAYADDARFAQEAARAWVPLEGGDGLRGLVNLTVGGDGVLHAAFARNPGDGGEVASSIPIDPEGRGGARETIAGSGRPAPFTGRDGAVRAVTGETGRGIGLYARGGGGAWAEQALVTDVAGSFYDYPTAVETPSGTLVTAAPGLGAARLFVGTGSGNAGVSLATSGNCDATSPAVALEPQTGEVWAAWLQSRSGCELPGVVVQRFDPAARALVGSPLVAPGSSGARADDQIAFTGRPGQPGLFVAFAADGAQNVRVWQVGTASSTAIPRRAASIRTVRIAAEPQGGRMWLAWHEADETRRVSFQSIAADGSPDGLPQVFDPPPGSNGLDDFRIVGRAGRLEIVGGALDRVWYARLDG